MRQPRRAAAQEWGAVTRGEATRVLAQVRARETALEWAGTLDQHAAALSLAFAWGWRPVSNA